MTSIPINMRDDRESLLKEDEEEEEIPTGKNRRHLWPKDAMARTIGAKMGTVGAAQISIRLAFLRKVFGILSAQVLLTVGICAAVYLAPHSKLFVQQHSWLLLLCLFGSVGLIIAMHVHARSVPLNYVLLTAFTVCQALTLGVIVSMYQLGVVLEAAVLTTVIVFSLFAYTLQSKRDFKKHYALAFSALCILVLATFFQIFLRSPAFNFFVNVFGALLFCFFIIIDLDLIMGTIEAEDYVLACVLLYMDIINLFIHILQLLGEANRN